MTYSMPLLTHCSYLVAAGTLSSRDSLPAAGILYTTFAKLSTMTSNLTVDVTVSRQRMGNVVILAADVEEDGRVSLRSRD